MAIKRRIGSGVMLIVLAVAVPPGSARPADEKPVYFKGKVVPLAGLLAGKGVALDSDAGPHWLALVSEDGKVYPLVKNDGSRLFFKDKKLHGRPMRLTGRLVPGTGLLEVRAVHSVVKGKLHEVYYWCDNCALAYSEPGECLCCGAAVKLVEVEVNDKAPAEKLERLKPR